MPKLGGSLLLPAALLALLAAGSLLGGCSQQAEAGNGQDGSKLVIGYKENGPLAAVRMLGTVEKRLAAYQVKVGWRAYSDDAALLRALQEGTVGLGSVSDAAMALALDGTGEKLYVLAAEPANPEAVALIVKPDSGITEAAGLRGLRVVYPADSAERYLLLETLNLSGLQESAVTPVPVAPAELVRSFRDGTADAWVIAEPELSRLEPEEYRIVSDGQKLGGGFRDLYLTSWGGDKKEVLDAVLEEIDIFNEWTGSDVHKAAELLAANTDITHLQWLSVFERKAYGTAPMLDSIVKEEQGIVDNLYRLHIRNSGYVVRDMLLPE